MALNDYRGSNSSGRRKFDPTYYARYHCFNFGELSRLNITYSSGMMKLTIAKAATQNDNYEDQLSVFLTGVKANLLLNEMNQFEEQFDNLTVNQAFGVTTGMSEVSTAAAFHKNSNGGKAFIIAKVDQTGRIINRCEFNFPVNYDFSMEWDDFDSMKLSKKYDNDLQYHILKQTISDFADTIGGGSAYNTIDLYRYDTSRVQNNMDTILDKLGVRRPNSYNYNRPNSSNNYFNNNNSSSSNNGTQSSSKSLDDIDDMLSGDDLE